VELLFAGGICSLSQLGVLGSTEVSTRGYLQSNSKNYNIENYYFLFLLKFYRFLIISQVKFRFFIHQIEIESFVFLYKKIFSIL